MKNIQHSLVQIGQTSFVFLWSCIYQANVFISAYFEVQLLFWPVSILCFIFIEYRKGILAWNGLNNCLLTAYGISCVILDLHPQDHCLFDWTRCIVSLSFLFSDTLYLENINSWSIFDLSKAISIFWQKRRLKIPNLLHL